MRSTTILAVMLLLGCSVSAIASDVRPGGGRRPLDLPAGGLGRDSDDESGCEYIDVFGSTYEGDAFFWCLDKSCSMGADGGAPLAALKQEMSKALDQLSSRAEFSIVTYNTTFDVLFDEPRRARLGNRTLAKSFVNSMVPAGTTCLTAAAVKIVEISNKSKRRNKAIVIIGDGAPECPPPYTSAQGEAALNDITAANYERTRIHTIFISASETGATLMRQLAALNGGTFTQVD